MRLQLLSDPHHDVAPLAHPVRLADGADVIVVAGDVCEGARASMEWVRARFPAPTPVVTVMGNHTFYRHAYDVEQAEARAAAADLGITLLDDDVAVIGGVRFVGGVLWTDYRLYGEASQFHAMQSARTSMNDHRLITWRKKPWLRFRPQEALAVHQATRAFIEDTLAVPFDGPTVVVTHHAPSPRSIDQKYAGELINSAYASDLEAVIATHQPTLWLHGHVHSSFDYELGATRVIANPMGYGDENPNFNPDLVVDLVTSGAEMEQA